MTKQWDDPELDELTGEALKQWNQALTNIRTDAAKKALKLVKTISENETRTGHPFTTIQCHLLLACDELHTVINCYRNHT